MTREDFIKEYYDFARRVVAISNKARREGLLALEEILDKKKVEERDIFYYGLRFVIDGTERETIERILSNIINQEKDENKLRSKIMQMEAVLMIQEGCHPLMLHALLNSYTDLSLNEDEILKSGEFY